MVVTIGNTKRDIEVTTSPNGNVYTKDWGCIAYTYRTGKKIHLDRGHVVNGKIQPTWNHGSMMYPLCFADEVKTNNTTKAWI